MSWDYETLVAAAIIAFFGYVMWRGGTTNPVGTGQLQRQLQALGVRMGRVEKTVEGCAMRGEVEQVSRDLKSMEERVASSGEVLALQGQIAAMNMRMAGIEQLASRTDAGVARIEGYFLEKGINGK